MSFFIEPGVTLNRYIDNCIIIGSIIICSTLCYKYIFNLYLCVLTGLSTNIYTSMITFQPIFYFLTMLKRIKRLVSKPNRYYIHRIYI